MHAEERDELIVDALEESLNADNRRVFELVLETESERARPLDAEIRGIRRPTERCERPLGRQPGSRSICQQELLGAGRHHALGD